jgi:hypothetical protein
MVQEIRRLRRIFDCWHTNNRTMVESADFKRAVVDFYQRRVTTGPLDRITTARCMISDEVFEYKDLCPAHLVKHCRPELMSLYGLTPLDVDNPRNGILVLKEIEIAFDHKDLCFLLNPMSGELNLRVLNQKLMGKCIHPTSRKTFSDIDKSALKFPADHLPFRRILSMHAKLSLSRALRYQWIDGVEEIDTYFNVSEPDLEEPDFLGLTWKQINYEDIENTFI